MVRCAWRYREHRRDPPTRAAQEFHRRYPDVKLDLSTRPIKELTELVLAGELDAALVAEPIADVFEKKTIYNEELALIAAAGHPPIRSPRDVQSETVLAFEHGCPIDCAFNNGLPIRRASDPHC